MGEHISNERLAALLDDGVDDDAAREHLAACPVCERELDLLRRMRMALSAMDDLEPPAGQWASLEAALPPAGEGAAGAERRTGGEAGREGRTSVPLSVRLRDVGWLRAAAGVVLFAGGLWLGSLLGSLPGAAGDGSPGAPAGTSDGAALATGDEPVEATAVSPDVGSAGDGELADADADEILRRLEALGRGELDARDAYRDPTAAAERLARLDALVRAAREALEEDPANPAMNQFLFRVVEERQQLNEALHLASLDYR